MKRLFEQISFADKSFFENAANDEDSIVFNLLFDRDIGLLQLGQQLDMVISRSFTLYRTKGKEKGLYNKNTQIKYYKVLFERYLSSRATFFVLKIIVKYTERKIRIEIIVYVIRYDSSAISIQLSGLLALRTLILLRIYGEFLSKSFEIGTCIEGRVLKI